MKLAMEIVRLLPLAFRQRKSILVVINYYSKWVDAEAFAQVKGVDIEKFVWKEIIYRFRLLMEIVMDNGTQLPLRLF